MNIKQHIEAGHYPKDEKGRALAPTRGGEVATIYATDCPDDDGGGRPNPIVGFVPGIVGGLYGWQSDGVFTSHESGYDLLPPAPRKVEVKLWGIYPKKAPTSRMVFETREEAERWGPLAGESVVELTGSYEEPWPESAKS